VLVPILEDILGYDSVRIRTLFESHGFVLHDWGKACTDSLTIAAASRACSVVVSLYILLGYNGRLGNPI
jgi:hypothetical protein